MAASPRHASTNGRPLRLRPVCVAAAVALALESECPDLVVHKMFKKLREGKVLLDWRFTYRRGKGWWR